MVLVPKSVGGYIDIVLFEFIWNFYAPIVNNRLQSTIILHNALHGFRWVKGTGMEIMEKNMEQQLAGIFHEPLLKVFIEVQKAYDSLNIGICMEILRGSGLVPKL